MQTNIGTKLELNVQKANPADATAAGTFAIKGKIPVIVVSPDMFIPILQDRNMKYANYKIIVAVDFNNLGKAYAFDKIRDLPAEVLGADGFDVLLTPRRTDIESSKEMKEISAFFKKSNPLCEVRWVLGRGWSEENLITILNKAKSIPANYIRTDSNLVTQVSIEDHKKDIERIRLAVPTPIKISGNVDLETFKAFSNKVARFDVSMTQARALFNEYFKSQEPKAEQETPAS